jgi:hypothetical protein
MAPKGGRASRGEAGSSTTAVARLKSRLANGKPPQPSPWFWGNLVALIVLIGFGLLLFDRHFKLYFNQALLVGGAISLWAMVQLLWGFFAKMSGFDAEDYSRQWLNSAAATRVLIVATLLLAYLWWAVASLYFEFVGDAAKRYQIEVTQVPSGQNYLAPFALTASERTLLKDLQLVGAKRVGLRCQIIDPVGFEPADCSIVPGTSTRIAVPTGFKAKEYHLVRLMPLGPLYQTVPPEDRVDPSNFSLEVVVRRKDGTTTAPEHLTDLRRLDNHDMHVHSVIDRYVQDHVEADTAQEFAAVLGAHTREWPLTYLRAGDELMIDVVRTPRAGEDPTSHPARRTFTYPVSNEPVQNVWLTYP